MSDTRLKLLNIQYDPKKNFVAGKSFWIQVQSQNGSIHQNLEIQKNCSIALIPNVVNFSDIASFCTTSHYESVEKQSLFLETEFGSRSMTHSLGMIMSHILLEKFLRKIAISSETPPTCAIKDEQDEIICSKF